MKKKSKTFWSMYLESIALASKQDSLTLIMTVVFGWFIVLLSHPLSNSRSGGGK